MDFVTDENPNKNVARYMMKMTNKLNKKYFKDQDKNSTEIIQAITCYTCHRGAAMPLVKAPLVRKDSVTTAPRDSTKAPQ